MAGMTQDEFDAASRDILSAWERATTRDDAFKVLTDYGRKYGYKNVVAAIQGRMPKRFTREKSVDEWVDERKEEEAVEPS